VESLVMASEISGLDDRHAYLKLGNNVARFDFDYIDLLGETEAFIPRVSEDDELQFARTRMGTVDPTPETPEVLDEEDEELDTEEEEFDEEGEHFTRPDDSPDDPLSGPLQQEIPQKRSPIPWPGEQTAEVARAGERNRPMPTPATDQNEESVAIAMHPEKSGQQIDLGF
jgi:hypothetical protein